MGLIMTVVYLAGFHQPEPHHVPVAVVGQGPQAAAVAEKVQSGLGDMVDVKLVATKKLAEDSLKRLEVAGAFIPGKERTELLTAPAHSETTSNVVIKMFAAVSEKVNVPMHVTEIVPLNSHDSAGQNTFFFLIILTISAYSLGIAIAVAGASYSFMRRVAIVLAASIVVATIDFLIARYAMSMFIGHEWALWGLALLYAWTIMALSMGLHSVLGRWSAMTFSALFVALNFTSSGGVFEPFMQPAFFGWLNNFWVGSGFIQATRQVIYFPDASDNAGFAILLGWFIASLLVLWLGAMWESAKAARALRPAKHDLTPEQEAELEEDVAVS